MKKSPIALAALLAFTSTTHFVAPRPFERIVPPFIGHAHFWVFITGIGELGASASLLHPRTRKRGAQWCMALFVLVFPANVYMAVDKHASDIPTWISWARLPLQPLLIWWAHSITKHTEPFGRTLKPCKADPS